MVSMDILTRLEHSGIITAEVGSELRILIAEKGISYEEALLGLNLERGVIRTEIAKEYGIEPYVLEKEETIGQEFLRYIPEESARHYGIMPLKIEDGVLVVGTNDPENLEIREVLNFISTRHTLPYRLVYMFRDEIEKAHSFYASLTGEIDQALGSLDLKTDGEKIAQNEAANEKEEDLSHIKEDAPVTKVVATVLRYAVDGKASDIHIEPTDEKVVIRFRVDGLLQKSLELPKNVQ